MSGLRPDRPLLLASIDIDLNDVAGRQPLLLGGVRANQNSVVPTEVRDRLRGLLEPAIVGPTAVVDHRVATEDDLHRLAITPVVARLDVPTLGGDALRPQRRVGYETIVQRFAPLGFEIPTRHLALPVLANDVVARGLRGTDQGKDEFILALAVEKRRNQRLHDAVGSVEGPGVSPLFQIMRAVDMPVNKIGR